MKKKKKKKKKKKTAEEEGTLSRKNIDIKRGRERRGVEGKEEERSI